MKNLLLIVVLVFAVNPLWSAERVKDCTGENELAITSDLTFAKNNYKDFEKFVEDRMDINLKNCIKNRLTDNGKVVCELKTAGKCKSNKGDVNAWASYMNKKVHICPYFRSNISKLNLIEKKVCYFALLVHEFGHTCDRGHGKVEPLDNLAFQFAQQKFGTSISMLNDCGMD